MIGSNLKILKTFRNLIQPSILSLIYTKSSESLFMTGLRGLQQTLRDSKKSGGLKDSDTIWQILTSINLYQYQPTSDDLSQPQLIF